MISYASTKPPTYHREKRELRIRWDMQQVEIPSGVEGETELMWRYNECLADVYDTREVLIRKIIASVHSLEDEIALINNQNDEPEEYAEYQVFRVKAKELADGWLAQVVDSVGE